MNSIDKKETRKFGIIALLFFGALSALGFWMQKVFPSFFFGFLSLMGLGFILFPSVLRPVYSGWMKVAHFVGKVITAVILTLAYYLVITPSALIKRLFGGTPIPLKFNKKAETYWVKRTETAQPKERFLKRY